ncbi:TniQ family protein [Streptomyces sp. LN499]|uniref:TniQ family protein n=1 Tax=Streptomyces sp. LN499 TaxID=3112977 RepID=UPI003723F955
MTPRALARSLIPLPEESLSGYLLRLAYRLNRSPARVAELCGISSGRQRRLTADHLVELPAHTAAGFARASGLSATDVHDLTLKRYAHAYPPLHMRRGPRSQQDVQQGYFGSISTFYATTWGMNFSSRFCPDCLTGDGSPAQDAYGGPWKLRWHLPVVFACTRHQRLLENQCPSCRSPLNQSYESRAALITQPTSPQRLHPLQCRNAVTGPDGPSPRPNLCGARLEDTTDTSSEPLPRDDHQRLLDLQARLESRLSLAPGCTQPSRQPAPLQDLVHTAQLIKLSWPTGSDIVPSPVLRALIDDHAAPLHTGLTKASAHTTARFRRLWSPPQDSAQSGALLLAAQTLLESSGGPSALRERIQPLVQSALASAPQGACRSFFRRSEFSPTMARAMARRVHGFYAAGPLEYATMRVASRDCAFAAEEVPAHLPKAWYDTNFTDFADHVPHPTPYTVHHLRRVTCLKLVEMTAGGSWLACAQALDIPTGQAHSSLSKLRIQFGDSNLWTRFENTAELIAQHLDDLPHRVSYAHRRRTLATWQLPDTDWNALCAGLPLAHSFTARFGTRLGTVLTWAETTQSDHRLCPLLTELPRSSGARLELVEEISKFLTPRNQRGGSPLELRHRIARYAERLGSRCDNDRHSTRMLNSPL